MIYIIHNNKIFDKKNNNDTTFHSKTHTDTQTHVKIIYNCKNYGNMKTFPKANFFWNEVEEKVDHI